MSVERRLIEGSASERVVLNARAMRKARRMTAERLAKLLNERGLSITRGVLTNQETRRAANISIGQVVALADIFQVPIERLLQPGCDTCANAVPAGFTCNSCGLGGNT